MSDRRLRGGAPEARPGGGQPPAGRLAPGQRWLLRAITARRAPADLAPLARIAVPARTGLEVYRNAYRVRLHDCLADDFPAVQSLLGADRFAALAAAVIAGDPPRDATLNRYGRALVRHLAHGPAADRLAADLARLEWALVEAIHAPLAQPLDPAALAAIPPQRWAGLRLVRAPSLRLVASRFPIDGCYRQHLRGERVVAPAPDPEVVAVVRGSDGLQRRIFAPGPGRLVARLARGAALGPALAACRLDPEAVRAALAAAMAHGCFTAIDLETT